MIYSNAENEHISQINFSRKIGIAADHAGFELKGYLLNMLRSSGYQVSDFGADKLNPGDDYPDYMIPLGHAIANGNIDRGIAVCGSGVGACIIANKIPGIRACLIHEAFSARQGVEDDDMNIICLGGRVVSHSFAWELTSIFLSAKFSGEERHKRRLAKMLEIENKSK
jgi:ribose 5-phosphate isomerase B